MIKHNELGDVLSPVKLSVKDGESCFQLQLTFFRYAFLISSLPTSDFDHLEARIHAFSHLHSRRVRLREVHRVSSQLALMTRD